MVRKRVGVPVAGRRVVAKQSLFANKRLKRGKVLQTVKPPKRIVRQSPKPERKAASATPQEFRLHSPLSPNRQSIKSCTEPVPHSPIPNPVFPSLSQNLHWDPYVKTAIIPYQEKLHNDSNTYYNSTKEFSLSKIYQVHRDNPVRPIKNNVKFADQSTMTTTVKLSSVGCSHYPPSAPKFSDMFIPCSVLPVRDTQGQDDMRSRRYETREQDLGHTLNKTNNCLKPTPLKPPQQKFYRPACMKPVQKLIMTQNTNQNSQCLQCEFPGTYNFCREKKKVLYNEGIYEYQPILPKRRPLRTPPSTPVKGGNNLRNSKGKESVIPFSHSNDSKYHNCCLKPAQAVAKDSQLSFSQRHMAQKQSKVILRPKKMLASEMDIDAFLFSEPAICQARHKPDQSTMTIHSQGSSSPFHS